MNNEINDSTRGNFVASLRGSLLDSNLIGQTINKKQYNIKLINCNNYIQLYKYKTIKYKKDKSLDNTSNTWKIEDGKIVSNNIINKKINNAKTNKIRSDNITRSKLSMQRLAKTNCEVFQTFITLTIAENISEIEKANKLFNNWRTRIKNIFQDFKYICVPEFQKRGAVHFHLVTNIPLNSKIIKLQECKTNQYDVIHWNYGFSSVFPIKGIDVVAYMSKYMTKDIDNRLFGHKRYYYSKNLIMPKQEFLNDEDFITKEYINNLLLNTSLKYNNMYFEKFSNNLITFNEYIYNRN